MKRSDNRAVLVAAAVAIAAAMAGYFVYGRSTGRRTVIESRGPVLLADFVNTTGDALFDGSLRDALAIQLEQSPYLEVLSAERIAPLDPNQEPKTGPGSAEAAPRECERAGAAAILVGSIAPVEPSGYAIAVEAQTCPGGKILAQEERRAASKDELLPAVGAVASAMRVRFGEPPESIRRFDAPIERAITASVEALAAYSTAVRARAAGDEAQAIPLFEEALDRDPKFALAAARLGALFAELHDIPEAQRYIKRAFAGSGALTERERLSATVAYHGMVTGRLDEMITGWQRWTQTYPRDWLPHHGLSIAYQRMNRLDEAREEARAGIALAPREMAARQQLARTLLAMDRADEAEAAVREAAENGLDSSFGRALRYRLAFREGDSAARQQLLQQGGVLADGYLVTAEAARAAAASGALAQSRTLYARAIEAATAADRRDYAGGLLAEQAVAEALLGEIDAARHDMYAAVKISEGPDTLWMASLAASFAGLVPQARELAVGYAQLAPPAPDIVATVRPILEAAVSLASREAPEAIAALARADPFARASDPWVPFLRGLARAAAGDHEEAAGQFRAAIAGLSRQPITLVHPLARLQLARALRAMNDLAGARDEYARVVKGWEDADVGQPFVSAVRREAQALGVAVSSRHNGGKELRTKDSKWDGFGRQRSAGS